MRAFQARGAAIPLFMLCLGPVGGCAAGAHRSEAPPPGSSFFISSDRIAASGARTVWEALQLTVPVLSFRESSSGRPIRVTRRGKSSLLLDDQPRIFIDRLPVVDITVLGDLPASVLLSIEVLNGLDGTTYYGTNSTDGVILLTTTQGQLP